MRLDGLLVVADDQQQCRAQLAEVADTVEALVLEVGIAYRQRFVHDEDVRATGCGHAECQSHLHAAGIHAHRLVDIVADLGEGFDLRHQVSISSTRMPSNWPAMYAFWRPVNSGMEAHAQLQQCGDAAGDRTLPVVGWVVPVIILSKVLLPAPLMPMMPTASPGDGEVDVLQHPMLVVAGLPRTDQPLGQPAQRVGYCL